MTTDWPRYELSDADLAALTSIVEKVRSAPGVDPRQPDFYDRNRFAVRHLPAGLWEFLDDFRHSEPAAACSVLGFPVDDRLVGPTPTHWDAEQRGTHVTEVEVFMALCGMALGDPFTWATLQGGRLIQNIVPIAGDEGRQNGHGSEALLEFHTEDAFHPSRCDYLLLFGVRNEDKVATTVASVRELALDPADVAVLGQRRYHILPDDEHIRQLTLRQPDHPALKLVERMRDAPEPVAVLFGDPARPYLRIDLPFMRCVGDDPVAQHALDALHGQLLAHQHDVVVERGTLLVVDNYQAVHGRKSFRARYDGTDRWLKKLTVSRNLRAGSGSPAGSRVLV
ncbi:arginine beta-hydroxylase, Fe(II)/alpha-ketoglutarate-dependent [Micromonospora phaseoli]|uniref:Arginine beta-hydroxylase, Fe(II)/alpha-ketoglutarate-dependent n=1 Tax=Micromonospora phaseoli TaxID=1144548 RepID=A0A1H7CWG7_9ACTN|nr:guanitoxin biosynthesis L-enduracididine beta-hydroxylase GntD [Micromonospora phaseoli]PZV91670.1 Fe(II)/alpha-ketoglutarate-dependent arginine beta-hydroxylase [Micromonospora phaseoli]GIJ79302.1 L-asparagine oxygenase [Micromonospora phaseoli]SEJ91070.1 arginine beta-hydroxylase, Fe(II)/alpha-ketoglutarate-dependent [Micromonospora phaseoli]